MNATRISNFAAALSVFVLCCSCVGMAAPLGTAFTYQGHLYDANQVANGPYDLQFKLYDAASGGSQKAGDANVPDVNVVNGYFTVSLDFGDTVFDGNEQWLEIGVRPGDQGDPNAYIALAPRQRVAPTPHAIYARTAGSVAGGMSWSGITEMPAGFADGTDNVGLTVEADPQVSSATTDSVPKWNGTTLIDSVIYENGGKVGVGTSSPTGRFEVVNFLPSGNIAQEQSQTFQDTEYSSISGWQVFTPAVTGELTHVALVTRDPYEVCILSICGWNPASAVLSIYAGEGAGGTPIATQSISIAGGGYDGNSWAWISYGISAHPYLVSGQKYTFKVSLTTGTNDRSWCRYASSGDYYPAGSSSLGAGRDFEFITYMNAYTSQSAIAVTSEGAVGIGTASPTQKLDIAGSATVSGNLGIGTTSPTAKLEVIGTAKATEFVGGGSGLTGLLPDTDWVVSEPNVYRATGNVGIGTTSPSQKLHVAGNAVFSGNVGIGTTSPTAMLDVDGIAKVQGKQVTVGEENLRIIRGTVLYDGGIHAGSGFTVAKQATGIYHINFSTAFSARPSVTATWKYPDTGDDFGSTGTSSNVYTTCVIAVDTTHCRIKSQGTSGNAADRGFEFIAVGPR
jgi:hypothetical protein